MSLRIILGAALLALVTVLVAPAAEAQTPVRVRGAVEKLDGNVLTVKSREGPDVQIKLADNFAVAAVVATELDKVAAGTFIGTASMKAPDGSLVALEVLLFPEAMRGTGEGHRPYAPVKGSTMTNGAAAGATVTGVDGGTMKVKYKDGEKTIVVPPNVPIVRYEIGSKGDLKAGARFTVSAPTKKADGTLEASRINVGREGVVPQ
jgi:hypothetical protein